MLLFCGDAFEESGKHYERHEADDGQVKVQLLDLITELKNAYSNSKFLKGINSLSNLFLTVLVSTLK